MSGAHEKSTSRVERRRESDAHTQQDGRALRLLMAAISLWLCGCRHIGCTARIAGDLLRSTKQSMTGHGSAPITPSTVATLA